MTPNYSIVPLTEAIQAAKPDSHPVVLIVDDEKIIADTLTAIFNRSGYKAFAAYDAKQALELATLVPPQMLITDVMMPGMNGIELAIEVTSSLPDCEILLFSGRASTNDLLEEARTMGYDFTALTKPVHPTELLKHASDSLRSAKLLRPPTPTLYA